MTAPIPLMDLTALHRPMNAEFVAAFADILNQSSFIGGTYVRTFEQAFAKACGTRDCVSVANGTDALMLALRAFDIGPGDTVLVPALTFIATAEAVSMVGATPKCVDVDPATYTMDPNALAQALQRHDRIKAVIPVHLYGQPAAMDRIMSIAHAYGAKVIEDCAQAHGARYKQRPIGSWGDLAAFSFYPTKNLGALGDAGAVVGNDATWLEKVRRIGNHGRVTQNEHNVPGINSRLDAIQAAVLTIKLPHLPVWNQARQRVASWYTERLSAAQQQFDHVIVPRVGPDREHVYHQYVIQLSNRDHAQHDLAEHHISTGVHYSLPIHLQTAYANLGNTVGDFPVAEQVAAQCLSLPMDPMLTEAHVDRVVTALTNHLRATQHLRLTRAS